MKKHTSITSDGIFIVGVAIVFLSMVFVVFGWITDCHDTAGIYVYCDPLGSSD